MYRALPGLLYGACEIFSGTVCQRLNKAFASWFLVVIIFVRLYTFGQMVISLFYINELCRNARLIANSWRLKTVFQVWSLRSL